MIKIMHLITNLEGGGTENVLYKLLANIDNSAFQSQVVSMMNNGPTGSKIQARGIPVRTLGMKRNPGDLAAAVRLLRIIRQDQPDIVQTWLYHADLFGGLTAKMARLKPIIWNIRHSNLDPKHDKRTSIWTVKVCSYLSYYVPFHIVACSESSKRIHASYGYDTGRMTVIHNGFELDRFKPDRAARIKLRQELRIPEQASVIGMVARYHPQKDHHNFVQAANILVNGTIDERTQVDPNSLHFLLCGEDVSYDNEELVGWIEQYGLSDHFSLLGQRDDIPQMTAALDIASLSSKYGEGFSNVIGEAMACGVPCAVTDIGDSALIVGDSGQVVPSGNPQALATAWQNLLELSIEGRIQLGVAARARVVSHFSLESMVRRYQNLYWDVSKLTP